MMSVTQFEEQYKKGMKTALIYLTQRAMTSVELEKKLKLKGFEQEIILKIIQECKNYKYIDDTVFAESYIRQRRNKGYGDKYIRYSLKKKGLDETVFNDSTDKKNTEIDSAKIAIRKKMKSFEKETDLYKRKEKMYRYLYSRGFSSSVISSVLNSFECQTESLESSEESGTGS